jgi:hypothetical protein
LKVVDEWEAAWAEVKGPEPVCKDVAVLDEVQTDVEGPAAVNAGAEQLAIVGTTGRVGAVIGVVERM